MSGVQAYWIENGGALELRQGRSTIADLIEQLDKTPGNDRYIRELAKIDVPLRVRCVRMGPFTRAWIEYYGRDRCDYSDSPRKTWCNAGERLHLDGYYTYWGGIARAHRKSHKKVQRVVAGIVKGAGIVLPLDID